MTVGVPHIRHKNIMFSSIWSRYRLQVTRWGNRGRSDEPTCQLSFKLEISVYYLAFNCRPTRTSLQALNSLPWDDSPGECARNELAPSPYTFFIINWIELQFLRDMEAFREQLSWKFGPTRSPSIQLCLSAWGRDFLSVSRHIVFRWKAADPAGPK